MKKQLDDSGISNQDAALCHASGQSFYNTSPFTLRGLKARAKQQQLKADFEAYLDGFSPNVQEILDKFKFRNQIPTLVEADILGHLIEKFVNPSINLGPIPIYDSDGNEKLPALDNHAMGTIFEELIRRFNEENNEEAGEHFTPRDVVRLMSDLVFLPVADRVESGTYLVYDGACGTGGMLTVAEERLSELAAEHGKDVSIHLYGQEINPETFAITKADLLLKGKGAEAENMVGHFHDQVLARRKIGGQARAMVVTGGIQRAVQYYHAIADYLRERKSQYKAIVAFSGEHDYGGRKVTEASLNGFPSSRIVDRIQEDPYRFLVVAEKFQTGYDEPLLHTMYVDKVLTEIKAVQTLSRLNRANPNKHDTLVLDFVNDADTIEEAFAPYYRTTILSEETDPNKLHDLKAELDRYQVYAPDQTESLAELYLGGEDRDRLDPILDACVAMYKANLDEDGQVDFKGKAKAFVRTHGFLALILPYTNAEWEKLSIFLNFLIPKLPAPREDDLSKGILEAIDMDSYRVEVKASMEISLPDEDGEIEPVPTSDVGGKPEPELDLLSNIIKAFNDQFGNIDWKDRDRIEQIVSEEIPAKAAADKAYRNAIKNSDRQNPRIEHDKALERAVLELVVDDTELFKQFSDNPSFRKWLADSVFTLTYKKANSLGG